MMSVAAHGLGTGPRVAHAWKTSAGPVCRHGLVAMLFAVATIAPSAQQLPAPVPTLLPSRPPTPPPEGALVTEARAYVDTFEKAFGSVVAEERYEQQVMPSLGTGRRTADATQATTLVSDFLFVQLPLQGWVPFRDVFERDGKPVRDRQDRLMALFVDGANTADALAQARRILDESSRYNIGDVVRNMNIPTLALMFLRPQFLGQSRFVEASRDDGMRVLEFRETARPTIITTTNGRDLPASGKYWIDASGTIVKTELDVRDSELEVHVTVTYRKDETLQLWVPARMDERYRRTRSAVEIRGTATYSKFRRFQVRTSESLVDDPK